MDRNINACVYALLGYGASAVLLKSVYDVANLRKICSAYCQHTNFIKNFNEQSGLDHFYLPTNALNCIKLKG